MKSFAEQLKEARSARNLTQEGLATLAGMSKSAVQYFEAGTLLPRAETLVRLCAVMEAPFLFSHDGTTVIVKVK